MKARTKRRAHERAIKRGNQNEEDSTTSMSKLCQHSQLSSSSRHSPASLKANKSYKRRKQKEKQRKRLEKEILTKWIPDATDKEGNGEKKTHVPLNVESPKVGKSNQEHFFKGKSLSKELRDQGRRWKREWDRQGPTQPRSCKTRMDPKVDETWKTLTKG